MDYLSYIIPIFLICLLYLGEVVLPKLYRTPYRVDGVRDFEALHDRHNPLKT